MPNRLPTTSPPRTSDPVIGWYVTGSSGTANSDGWVWTKVSYRDGQWLDVADGFADVSGKIQFWQEAEAPREKARRRE